MRGKMGASVRTERRFSDRPAEPRLSAAKKTRSCKTKKKPSTKAWLFLAQRKWLQAPHTSGKSTYVWGLLQLKTHKSNRLRWVPAVGLEPTWACARAHVRCLRLPISPRRHPSSPTIVVTPQRQGRDDSHVRPYRRTIITRASAPAGTKCTRREPECCEHA